MNFDLDDSEREELIAQVRFEKTLRENRLRHYDFRDPDRIGDDDDSQETDTAGARHAPSVCLEARQILEVKVESSVAS